MFCLSSQNSQIFKGYFTTYSTNTKHVCAFAFSTVIPNIVTKVQNVDIFNQILVLSYAQDRRVISCKTSLLFAHISFPSYWQLFPSSDELCICLNRNCVARTFRVWKMYALLDNVIKWVKRTFGVWKVDALLGKMIFP